MTGQQHYLRRCDWTGKYLELAGQRRKKYYSAICVCGFRAGAYGRSLAECKIYGHQETMLALAKLSLDIPELRDVFDNIARDLKTFYLSPKADISEASYAEYERIKDHWLPILSIARRKNNGS